MGSMPRLRVRRIGGKLGVVFSKEFVAEAGLKRGEMVQVVADVDGLESVRGSLTHLGLSVDEMNALTNEVEEF